MAPPIAALELRDLAPGRRVVDAEAPPSPFRVVYEEEAARDDGARPGVAVLPQRAQLAVAERPRRRATIVGGEQPGRRRGTQHSGCGEACLPGRDDLALAAPMRLRPPHQPPVEQPDRAVFAALGNQPTAEQHRRRRAQVRVTRVEGGGVGRRVVAEQPGRIRVELEHGVAPVGPAVPQPIAGRDEDVPGGRVDHRPGAAPYGGAALGAGRGIEDPRPVTAERIPHVQQLAIRGVQDRHMSLIRRRIPDVAAGGRDHAAAEIVERRRDLLAPGEIGDRRAPGGTAVRDSELVDLPVGRGRVHERSVGIGDWCRGRDPVRSHPRVVARRRVLPQDRAVGRVDGQRLAVRRGDEEDIAIGAVDTNAVQIDR